MSTTTPPVTTDATHTTEGSTTAKEGQAVTKPAEQPKETAKTPEGAPERYEFTTPKGLPEGHDLDAKVIESFEKTVRGLNLPQKSAQLLLDQVMPVIHQRAMEQQADLEKQWKQAVIADKDLGGTKHDATMELVAKGRKAFASESLQELLKGPLGSHPEMVRLFAKLGSLVKEDGIVGPNKGQPGPDDDAAMADKLYPKSKTAS